MSIEMQQLHCHTNSNDEGVKVYSIDDIYSIPFTTMCPTRYVNPFADEIKAYRFDTIENLLRRCSNFDYSNLPSTESIPYTYVDTENALVQMTNDILSDKNKIVAVDLEVKEVVVMQAL